MIKMSHLLRGFILVICCLSYVNSSFLKLLPEKDNDDEGFEKPNLRIVGGRPAQQSLTRHQVSLRLVSREILQGFGYGHVCGGSLIGPDLVLTAAHCMYKEKSLRKASEFRVVMGTMNITERGNDTLVYSVKSFKVHKRYSSVSIKNDIAILKLGKEVPANHTLVRPIALTTREVTVGTTCQITGWGAMRNEGPAVYYLQTADIQVQDINRCNGTLSYNGKIYPGMMCAGYFEGGVDSCQGDSGGPMVCNGVLTGVISWGIKCAMPQFPGIYSDIYYFRDWIENNSSTKLISSLMIMTIGFIMTLLI